MSVQQHNVQIHAYSHVYIYIYVYVFYLYSCIHTFIATFGVARLTLCTSQRRDRPSRLLAFLFFFFFFACVSFHLVFPVFVTAQKNNKKENHKIKKKNRKN